MSEECLALGTVKSQNAKKLNVDPVASRSIIKTNLMTQINTKNISVMGLMAMLSLFLANRHSV